MTGNQENDKERLMRYSILLAMFNRLYRAKKLTPGEYQRLVEKLKADYSIPDGILSCLNLSCSVELNYKLYARFKD